MLAATTWQLGRIIALAILLSTCAQGQVVERASDHQAAENALLYQRPSGGWPKGYDRDAPLNDADRQRVESERSRDNATIDNGATYTEIRLLAEAFQSTSDVRYRDAALRGVEYLLAAQYANGGWPQRFPKPKGYARFITFNDHAMIGVLRLLDDIATGNKPFEFTAAELRARCREAVRRGIDCILRCQIRVDGRPTVWCAQHHHETFAPEQARSYELPSFSGSESVGIVRFLMQIDAPSPEVVAAIEGAVAWLERAKLTGVRVVLVPDEAAPRGMDKHVAEDPAAPPIWARFYDLETHQPIYCDRDGVRRQSLADLSSERRNGYSWLGYYAQTLLEKDLPAWRARMPQPSSQ